MYNSVEDYNVVFFLYHLILKDYHLVKMSCDISYGRLYFGYKRKGVCFMYITKQKSVAMVIFLSIITCGIYFLVWMAQTTNDLNEASRIVSRKNPYVETIGTSGGMVVLFAIITCGVYSIFWWYKVGKVMQMLQIDLGERLVNDNSVIYLLLSIFQLSLVSMAILQSDLNNFWFLLDRETGQW